MSETFTPQPPITSQTKFTTARRSPAYRILLNGPFLAISVITLFVALLARLFGVGGNDPELFLALGILCSTMFMVRALYLKSERFMFSPTFWVLVTVFFYFVLKSVDWWSKDLITPTLVEAIWLCTLFLVAYTIVYALTDARLRFAVPRSRREHMIAPGATWALFAVYVAFKLLGVALFASAGGGSVSYSPTLGQLSGLFKLLPAPADRFQCG